MKKSNSISPKRRHFLQSLLSAGVAGSLGSLGQLALMREATAATPNFTDYKALVCVFLHGGNDSFNMMIPMGTNTGSRHSDYSAIRGSLAVNNTDLGLSTASTTNTPLSNTTPLGTGAANPYYTDGTTQSAYLKGLYDLSGTKSIPMGVNGVMPELAQLITDDKASVMSNIGNLVNPVTRTEVLNKTADLPLFLFAHNHQQRALQTGQGDNLDAIGWAGRIADNWPGINNSSAMGLNISYAGSNRMLIGQSTTPLVLNSGTPPTYSELKINTSNNHNDRRALFQALAGKTNTSASGTINFAANNTYATSDPFKQFYNTSLLKSLDVFDNLASVWVAMPNTYTTKDSYGNDLFSIPTSTETGFDDEIGGKLIKQLETAAHMIRLGVNNHLSATGYNRQIFMVNLGGFDTHAAQTSKHPLLLRELSLGLWKFQKAMEELNIANNVTTFTMSDFGRTMSNNGDGTDHAWGANHIVMGGDGNASSGNLRGGRMIGALPDITLDGADDYSAKGRIIPTTAQDQLNATLCDWFGVDTELMPTIFPNVSHFQSAGNIESAYLDQLFVS